MVIYTIHSSRNELLTYLKEKIDAKQISNFFIAQILISRDNYMDVIVLRGEKEYYDVLRADGLIIKNVHKDYLSPKTEHPNIPIGTRVIVQRKERPYWKSGEISGSATDFYIVTYDDNEIDYDINVSTIIPIFIPGFNFNLNQQVLINYNYQTEWLPATIISLDLKNRYTIESEKGIFKEFHSTYIKPNNKNKPLSLQLYDRVNVFYSNGEEYTGYIYDVEGGQMYSVLYDDGEIESNVNLNRIKLILTTETEYFENDVVEVYKDDDYTLGRVVEKLNWGRYRIFFTRRISGIYHGIYLQRTKKTMPDEPPKIMYCEDKEQFHYFYFGFNLRQVDDNSCVVEKMDESTIIISSSNIFEIKEAPITALTTGDRILVHCEDKLVAGYITKIQDLSADVYLDNNNLLHVTYEFLYIYPYQESYSRFEIDDSVSFLSTDVWIPGFVINNEDYDRYSIETNEKEVFNEIHISRLKYRQVYDIGEQVCFMLNNENVAAEVIDYDSNLYDIKIILKNVPGKLLHDLSQLTIEHSLEDLTRENLRLKQCLQSSSNLPQYNNNINNNESMISNSSSDVASNSKTNPAINPRVNRLPKTGPVT